MNNEEEAIKYKDYPEGSLSKKFYDSVVLPFDTFLSKYYTNPDLTRWHYVNSKFVLPIFDGTPWEEYIRLLMTIKPNFYPKQKN